MTANMHLAIVIGSTREGRFSSTAMAALKPECCT